MRLSIIRLTTGAILLAALPLNAASFNSAFKLKVYERGQGDEPPHVIGFTPLREGKAIDFPSRSEWYVKPIGSLDHDTFERLLEEVRQKKIPGLDLSNRWDITDEDLVSIGSLERLQTLYLSKTKMTDAGMPALATLKNLHTLELNNRITNAGLTPLQLLPKLEDLTLIGGKISDKGALAILPSLKQLKRLTLSDTAITDNGLKALASLTKLEALLLPSGITDRGIAALISLVSLKELDLTRTLVSDRGLETLRSLKNLKILYLNNRITDQGIATLAALHSLEKLDASGCPLTNTALNTLAGMKHLRALALGGTKITDAGLPFLASLPELETLELSDTKITHGGLALLVGAKQLETLSLSWQRLTEQDVLHLAQFPKLTEVILNGTPLPQTVFEQLKTMALLKQKQRVHTGNTPMPKSITPQPAATSVPAKSLPNEILRVNPLKTSPASPPPPSIPSHSLAPVEIPLVTPTTASNAQGVVFQQVPVKNAPGAPQLTGLRRLQQIQAQQSDPEDVTAATAGPSIKDPFEATGPGLGEIDVSVSPSKKKK